VQCGGPTRLTILVGGTKKTYYFIKKWIAAGGSGERKACPVSIRTLCLTNTAKSPFNGYERKLETSSRSDRPMNYRLGAWLLVKAKSLQYSWSGASALG
jgi:hypothetical protein